MFAHGEFIWRALVSPNANRVDLVMRQWEDTWDIPDEMKALLAGG